MIKRIQELKKQIKRATKDADETVSLNGTNYCLHGYGKSGIIDNFVMDLLGELEREAERIIKTHKDPEDRIMKLEGKKEKINKEIKYKLGFNGKIFLKQLVYLYPELLKELNLKETKKS